MDSSCRARGGTGGTGGTPSAFFLPKESIRDLLEPCEPLLSRVGADGLGGSDVSKGRASVLVLCALRGPNRSAMALTLFLPALTVPMATPTTLSVKESADLVERRECVAGDDGLTGEEGLREDGLGSSRGGDKVRAGGKVRRVGNVMGVGGLADGGVGDV